MYRPGIRMNDLFKEWGEEWTKATGLTIAQLMRLALVIGGESETFRAVASQYLKDGSPPPSPAWVGVEKWLWYQTDGLKEEEGRGHDNGATSLLGGDARGETREGSLTLSSEINRGRDGTPARRVGTVRNGQKTAYGVVHLASVERVGGVIRVSLD